MHFDLDTRIASKSDLKAFVHELGLELCGVTTVAALEAVSAPNDRPSLYSDRFCSAIVLGKAIYRGLSSGKHVQMRQFMNGRLKKRLEDQAGCVADTLEFNGHPSVALPSITVDHSRLSFFDQLPMAQGGWLVRLAAVASGLGTWGLNNMVLTPDFGPRLFFSMVLSEIELAPDTPLSEALCLGLEECGRCAVACPTRAIPSRGKAGGSLDDVRGLDHAACAKACQPEASHAFVAFIDDVVNAPDKTQRLNLVKGWRSGEMWQQMAMFKPGSLTGCMQCALACPVGLDYESLAASDGMPAFEVDHVKHEDGSVEVVARDPEG